MLVTCKRTALSNERITALGGAVHPQVFDVTEGETYLVLGLTVYVASRVYGSGVYAEIEDDSSHVVSVPLFLFEIVDGRPSQHWESRFWDDGSFAFWPPSFFNDCYHDRLSEGVPEVRRDYESVRAQLREEAGMVRVTQAH